MPHDASELANVICFEFGTDGHIEIDYFPGVCGAGGVGVPGAT